MEKLFGRQISEVQQTMKTASSDEELAFKQKVLWMQLRRAKKKSLLGQGGVFFGFSLGKHIFVFVYCVILYLSRGCMYRFS